MQLYKNSPGDHIANVNFYALQCAWKLREFAEITQNNAITPLKVVQGHRFLVPIESSYTISY